MLKVDKVVTVTISEEDVQTLKNICECARVHFDNSPRYAHWRTGNYDIAQWTRKELYAIGQFLNTVFEI